MVVRWRRLRKRFWYQDTGYPVYWCVCVSISPPHPTHPHPTPPQVAWWCDVRMCDVWWYGGEVAVRINNTLDRLEGSADYGVAISRAGLTLQMENGEIEILGQIPHQPL